MASRFDYFVVFAEMRTGSNFLEENINAIPGLYCWGEAFNPHFMGHAGRDLLAGVSKKERNAHPTKLIEAMRKETLGLAGFRFFHDHDPRVLDQVLENPRCAKIVLTRNPLDSYVSLKIARSTGQWRLGDMRTAKAARIRFEAEEFRDHVDALQGFQIDLMHRLQTSGQTAFYVAYEDVQDVGVLNGLARFLGVEGALEKPVLKTKVQNPVSLEEKVSNYDQMARALSSMDFFGLGRTPNFEPRRGPNVPSYVAAATAPLLFMPVAGNPEARLRRWLADLDGHTVDDLNSGRTQKDLRKWMRTSPGHRSFTVLRHPVDRLHEAFCRHILPVGAEGFETLRQTLIDDYNLPLPASGPCQSHDAEAHRAAFLAFAHFVKGNLGGQTNLRVDKVWASQNTLIQGMAHFAPPEFICHEDELEESLAFLAARIGLPSPRLQPRASSAPVPLSEIHDDEIETLIEDIYHRDYLLYGFRAWGS